MENIGVFLYHIVLVYKLYMMSTPLMTVEATQCRLFKVLVYFFSSINSFDSLGPSSVHGPLHNSATYYIFGCYWGVAPSFDVLSLRLMTSNETLTFQEEEVNTICCSLDYKGLGSLSGVYFTN